MKYSISPCPSCGQYLVAIEDFAFTAKIRCCRLRFANDSGVVMCLAELLQSLFKMASQVLSLVIVWCALMYCPGFGPWRIILASAIVSCLVSTMLVEHL